MCRVNPYESPNSIQPHPSTSTSRSIALFVLGLEIAFIAGFTFIAGGAEIYRIVSERPLLTCLELAIIAVFGVAVVSVWKYVRRLFLSHYVPSAVGRFVCGLSLAGTFFGTAAVLEYFDVFSSLKEISSASPYVLTVLLILFSVCIAVEIESRVSRRSTQSE